MEIWNSETNNSSSVGESFYAFEPLLLKTNHNECTACETDCQNGQCVIINSTEHCICNIGFENINEDSARPCDDINECDIINCGQGTCFNSHGSFMCHCDDGFENLNSDLSQPCQCCKKWQFTRSTGTIYTCEYDSSRTSKSGRWLYGPCKKENGFYLTSEHDQFDLTFNPENSPPSWETSSYEFYSDSERRYFDFAPDESNKMCTPASLTWKSGPSNDNAPVTISCIKH